MSNLQPLCAWHHRMKHGAHWRLTELDELTFRWTTPNGNHIEVRKPPVIGGLPDPVPWAEPTAGGGSTAGGH